MNYLLEQFGRIFQALSLAESGNLGAAKSLLNGFTTPEGTTAEQMRRIDLLLQKKLCNDF
jgi:hypothetical protein